MPPQVTVLLPHFRCEPFLAEAVGSILGQRDVELELAVIDDASTGTEWLEALAPFAADPRLAAYRSTRNVGPYRLKNALLPSVRTPYVALQDADDASEPERLRRQLAALGRTRADLVGCSFRYVSAAGEPLRRRRMVRHCNAWLRLGKGFVFLHPTLLARREVLDVLGGFDGTTRFGADDDFILRASRLFRIRNLPETLYHYRLRPDSLTGDPATGHGSAARLGYIAGLHRRRRAWRRLRDREALLSALRAPESDVEFELLPVALR